MTRDETGTITLDTWIGESDWLRRGRVGKRSNQAEQPRISGKFLKKAEKKTNLGVVPRYNRSRLLQTIQFMRDPVGLLEAARQECGDIFCLRLLGMGDWVFLCSPELVQELYQVPDSHLAAGVANRQFMGELLGAEALFCLDGPAHLDRRRIMFPLLNGAETLKQARRVGQLVDRMVDAWGIGQPISLLPRLEDVSLQALFLAALGEIEAENLERITAVAKEYYAKGMHSPLVMMPALRWNLGPKSPWGKILGMQAALQNALAQEIEDRRAHPSENPVGIVDALLQPRDDSKKPLSTREIVHELSTLGSASNESVPKLLAWTIVGILSNSEVVPKIRAELDQVVGDGPIEAHHVDRLEYLDAAIYEGMRFQPATDTAGVRRALRPTRLGGYLVPEGAVVTQCLSAIAKRPELFAQVDRFEPEHFLHTGLKAHQWKPFGGGRRTCTGKGFAMLVMKLVIATLFRRFDVEMGAVGREPVRSGFFRIPEGGGEVILRHRKETTSTEAIGVSPDMSVGVADMSRPSGEDPAVSEERPGKSPSRCPFAFLHRS